MVHTTPWLQQPNTRSNPRLGAPTNPGPPTLGPGFLFVLSICRERTCPQLYVMLWSWDQICSYSCINKMLLKLSMLYHLYIINYVIVAVAIVLFFVDLVILKVVMLMTLGFEQGSTRVKSVYIDGLCIVFPILTLICPT